MAVRRALVRLALVLVGVAAVERQNKVFVLPDSDREAAAPLLRAFALHGVDELQLDAPSWSAAADTPVFDLLWSQEVPPAGALGPLDARHRVNHVPGAEAWVTNLAETHTNLQRTFGIYDFSFVPPTYSVGKEKAKLAAAVNEVLMSPLYEDRVKVDPAYMRRWLVRDGTHTSLLRTIDELPVTAVVSKYVEPFLISGHKFAVDLFVLVASIDPLRVYVYDNARLRFCLQPYPRILDAAAELASYSVGDDAYLSPWTLADLKDYYTELPSAASEGTNHWRVLKRYLHDHNVDVDRFQRDADGIVAKIVAGRRKALQAAGATANHFELLQFTLTVQDDGQPFLEAVRRSPSLHPREAAEAGLFNNIAADVVQLVGVRAPADKTLAESSLVAASTYCKAKCLDHLRTWDMTCWRCPGWFSPPVAAALMGSATEFARRGRFRLVFPTADKANARFAQGLSAHDEALHAYLVSFTHAAAAVGTSLLDPAVLCVSRDQCSGHGDCINGRCRCDIGFEGFTCYIPRDPSLPPWTDAPQVALHLRVADGTDVHAPPRRSFFLVAVGLAILCFGLYQVALRVVVVAQAEKDN
ncbi:hypothetical protein ACHHYP_07433 [Achlya hypogyna]|uniref:Tubulin--tyrosine ligase-like protein 5 n=1 Tax=Achlya hypogyna TaxID=1202772 RepID=A0A1V9ZM12_ACHHY|nr:hypothetical protein ACHHYP_07433 [Achlya hypogyna]